MPTINIASKANQATTFPALLVASYVKESANDSPVNIIFEETESLKPGHEATVELSLGSSTSVYGSENSIESLVNAFPWLKSKNESFVCAVRSLISQYLNDATRSRNG